MHFTFCRVLEHQRFSNIFTFRLFQPRKPIQNDMKHNRLLMRGYFGYSMYHTTLLLNLHTSIMIIVETEKTESSVYSEKSLFALQIMNSKSRDSALMITNR